MPALVEALREVGDLEARLSAVTVIQEEIVLPEKGHYEDVEVGEEPMGEGSSMSDAALASAWRQNPSGMVPVYDKRWVVDRPRKVIQPRKTEPDMETRIAARHDLERIRDNSEWYSAKYQAGKALIKQDTQCNSQEQETAMEQLNEQRERWLSELCRGYDAIAYNSETRPRNLEDDLLTLGGDLRAKFIMDSPEKRQRFCELTHTSLPHLLFQEAEKGRALTREEWIQIYQVYATADHRYTIAGTSLNEARDGWLARLCKEYDAIAYTESGVDERGGQLEEEMLNLGGDLRAYFILDGPEKRERFCYLTGQDLTSFLAEEAHRGRELTEDELLRIYWNPDRERVHAQIAGKHLGYSKIRIWAHEHNPAVGYTAGVVGGVAGAVAASAGISYIFPNHALSDMEANAVAIGSFILGSITAIAVYITGSIRYAEKQWAILNRPFK